MPISVLPWASASRRLSFTRPSPPRASDASEDTYTWSCARPNCWNCCKREVLLSGEIWPRPLEMADRSRSDRAGHRWKEGNFLRPPPPSSFLLPSWLLRCASTRSKKGETWPCFGRPYINRGGKGKKAVDGDRYSSSSSKLGQSERPDLNIFRKESRDPWTVSSGRIEFSNLYLNTLYRPRNSNNSNCLGNRVTV